jgi:hypothetical protein
MTHPHDVVLDRYTEGGLPDSAASSVEAHLLTCAVCRRAVAGKADTERLDRLWDALADGAHADRVGVLERLLLRVGVSEPVARILVCTPSLRGPWLAAVTVTLVLAAAASHLTGGGDLPFLVVAPLMPVAGVALSFGRGADPAWEVGESTPTGGIFLVLIRTLAILAVCLTVTAAAALALPSPGSRALGWLLPSFCLALLTLTISTTRAAMPWVAAGVSIAWMTAVAVADMSAQRAEVLFGAQGQTVLGVLAAVALGVLLTRRSAIEQGSLR